MPVRSLRHPRTLLAYWLAIVFALRALLPQGFMPGAAPFTLKLCPAGLPAAALITAADPHAAHHAQVQHGAHAEQVNHQSHHQRADQCPFGAASAALALAHLVSPVVGWVGTADHSSSIPVTVADLRPAYRPQPRGPPAFS